MQVCHTIPALRAHLAGVRGAGPIAFVPTMGALHDGHGACVREARAVAGAHVVASIFVNPTQFGPGEDFTRYPRALNADSALLAGWGCDTLFAPSAEEMYPVPSRTWVEVTGASEPLCGRFRPGHFRGVATVVAKLFSIVQPDIAVFGQKDAQQALVIRALVQDLNLPVSLRIARTVREADGLAMSSRNAYLAPEERRRAPGLFRALENGGRLLAAGERDARTIEAAVGEAIRAAGFTRIDYAEARRAADLSALERCEGRVILAAAAWLSATRLIDNMVFDVGPQRVDADVTLFP